jgi:hypothetical protein
MISHTPILTTSTQFLVITWKSYSSENHFWEHFSTKSGPMGYEAIQIQMQKDWQVLNEAHAAMAQEEYPDLDHPAF